MHNVIWKLWNKPKEMAFNFGSSLHNAKREIPAEPNEQTENENEQNQLILI